MRVMTLAVLSCLAAAAIAGCSSDSYNTNKHATRSSDSDYGSSNGNYMADTSAGSVMTTPGGMTVYTFDKDQPGKSNCYGECAMRWPPVTADGYAQENGRMSLISRADGRRQWAYDGKPLYTYRDDSAAGDANGDNIRNVWHVVK